MLWQLVYSMRRELDELRKRMDNLDPSDAKFSNHAKTQSLIKYEPSVADDTEVEEVVASPTLEDSERNAVAAALRRNNGNKRKAAEQLNISQRTLYRKIHEYGLDLDEGADLVDP